MRSNRKRAELDDPSRYGAIRSVIEKKPALRAFYERVYRSFLEAMNRSPQSGIALELGREPAS